MTKELLEETCEQLFSAWRKDGQEGIRNKVNWVPMPFNKALGYFKVRFVLVMQVHNTLHR